MRRDLADESEHRVARSIDRGRLAGDEEGRDSRSEADGDPECDAELLDLSLQIEEVHLAASAGPVVRPGVARPRNANAASLAGGSESRADFKQPDVATTVAAVVRDRV